MRPSFVRYGREIAMVVGLAAIACDRPSVSSVPTSAPAVPTAPAAPSVEGRDYPARPPVAPLMPERALEAEVLRLGPRDRIVDHGDHVTLLSGGRAFTSWLDSGDVEVVADAWVLRRDLYGTVQVMPYVPTTAVIPDGPFGRALLHIGEGLAFRDWTVTLVAITHGRRGKAEEPQMSFDVTHRGRRVSSWTYNPPGSNWRHDVLVRPSRLLTVMTGTISHPRDKRDSTVELVVHEVEVQS